MLKLATACVVIKVVGFIIWLSNHYIALLMDGSYQNAERRQNSYERADEKLQLAPVPQNISFRNNSLTTSSVNISRLRYVGNR